MTTYITTLTRASQITLPKALQKVLKVETGDRLVYSYDERTKSITIRRQPSLEERLAELHDSYSDHTKENLKRAAKKYAGMTISEMREAWQKSPEGITYYTEKYGAKNA